MRAQASLALCFCALVTGAHNFLRRMESLHRNKGGASSKRAEPSEKEGMGLAVGAAMLWCKLRDSTSGAFFTKIAEEVKRCMDGDRTFSKEDMVHFVQNKLFGGIPQYGTLLTGKLYFRTTTTPRTRRNGSSRGEVQAEARRCSRRVRQKDVVKPTRPVTSSTGRHQPPQVFVACKYAASARA